MEENTLEKVALVTGGSRGIGRAIANELAKNYITLVNYNRSADEAEKIVMSIRENGGKAEAIQADVSVEKDVITMFQYIYKKYKRLDVLVNNAGITQDGYIMTMSLANWNKVITTNLTSVFLCTREALKIMTSFKIKGKIINMSSVSGVIGQPGQVNYCAAKGGIVAFSKGVAREVSKYGITVNVVAPGFIKSDMTKKVPQQVIDNVIENLNVKRLGTTEEVAKLVSYLVSDDASYFSGKVFTIDGGMVL